MRHYVLIFELPNWAPILKDPRHAPVVIEASNVVVNYIYDNNENKPSPVRLGNLPKFISSVEYSVGHLSEIYYNIRPSSADFLETSDMILDLLVELYQEMVHSEPGHFLAHDILKVTENLVWLRVTAHDIDERLLTC